MIYALSDCRGRGQDVGEMEQASVQYNDYSGTAAFDGHMGMSDAGILEAAGLDPKEYSPVGFEVWYIEHSADGYVYAVKSSELAEVDGLPGLAARDGALNAEKHEMIAGKAEDFLQGFKRVHITASYKGLPVRYEGE
jgi:hypothetical protein